MKRILKLSGILLILALVVGLVGAGSVFAQEADDDTTTGQYGFGRGPFRGQGPGMGLLQVDQDAMHEAIAEVLGITVEEFEAARAEGDTLYEIAENEGVDIETVWAAMRELRVDAIEEAVAEGLITEDQAEWLQSRPGPGAGGGTGLGMGPCGGTGEPLGQGNGPRNGMGGQGRGFGMGNGQGFGRQS